MSSIQWLLIRLIRFGRKSSLLSLFAICSLFFSLPNGVRAAEPPPSVEALVYTTLPSTSAHRPEMALDGDANTYFKSAYGMGDEDTFLVLLSQPIPVQSLHIVTGDADKQDRLTEGVVETSPDGLQFSKATAFDANGVADAALNSKPVKALRIRLNQRRSLPTLLIREITIHTTATIAHIQRGPGAVLKTSPRPLILPNGRARLSSRWSHSGRTPTVCSIPTGFLRPTWSM